jgi:hypothetical protein
MKRNKMSGERGDMGQAVIDGWIEKYSKKYDRSFWKNRLTGEKSWHFPQLSTSEQICLNNTLTDGRSQDNWTKNKGINDNISIKSPKNIIENARENEWESHISRKHNRIYYRNKLTNETTWTIPIEGPENIVKGNIHYDSWIMHWLLSNIFI